MTKPAATRRRASPADWIVLGWSLAVTLYFLWEASGYRGLYAALAEWQFAQLDHYFPALTFGVLVVAFAGPATLLFRSRRLTRVDRRTGDAVIVTETKLRRFLLALAGALALASLAPVIVALLLPRVGPASRTVTVGDPAAIAPPAGPATLVGRILYERAAAYSRNLPLGDSDVRFAPMVGTDDNDRLIRYFVELRSTERPPVAPVRAAPGSPPVAQPPAAGTVPDPGVAVTQRTGVLLKDQLPGAILDLYRYAGYRIADPAYVLFQSDRTVRSPYYAVAVQLLAAAILTLIAALIQHGRIVRRVRGDGAARP